MKARKKPVEIECWIFNLDKWKEDNNKYPMVTKLRPLSQMFENIPAIKTLEGNMSVSDGDYIIKGVQGEFYRGKPDIFKKTYDIIK